MRDDPEHDHDLSRIRTSDAARFAAFLTAAGFTEVLTVPAQKPGEIAHAQYAYGPSGGVMFGSVRDNLDHLNDTVGKQSLYVVVATDASVDELFSKLASHPGVRVTQEPYNPDHGGREFGITDPDGNSWGFGSYPGGA